METARVFWSRRSRAVRLQEEYRVKGCEVRSKRRGNAIVLEPIPDTWAWLEDLPRPLDEDFVEAAREQLSAPERPGLEQLSGDGLLAGRERSHCDSERRSSPVAQRVRTEQPRDVARRIVVYEPYCGGYKSKRLRRTSR